MKNPFRYFKTSPEIIRLAVMLYVRFPLSLRNVEDLRFCHVVEFQSREFDFESGSRSRGRSLPYAHCFVAKLA